ncbi:MAG: ArsA family ATPase [Acidobacteria bacterium]|nr:ArsA family ATPase [Acidobacteriota bacterium]MCA1648802.1 ArsA family ATPase [Acidobacteriota bacterium]
MPTRYRFVGGKGGVGKTTCAAAMAVSAARGGQRTLLISTDPAPSLADALRRPLSDNPRRVALRTGALHAVEIDSRRALDRWLAPRRPILERIALRGTWLDEEDVTRLLRLALPGIDELAALLEIRRLARDRRYDLVVVDTAPTGHTLRMLGMPDALRRLATVFDHMQAKHRTLSEALRGAWQPDAADTLIDELDTEGREMAALLRDPASTEIWWVTLPEPMSVAETLDAAAALERQRIPLHAVIVNRLTPLPDQPCRWCKARRGMEHNAIRSLANGSVRQPRIVGVMARDQEPAGALRLAAIGAEIDKRLAPPKARGGSVARVRGISGAMGRTAPVEDGLVSPGVALIMFGGKGGVGKTTCAAAAALDLARRHPRLRVLLLSTDPAHSLGDALGVVLTDEERVIPGGPANLRVRELDASLGFRRVRERYGAAIDAMFDRLARGSAVDVAHDRQVLQDLMDLAPPGIDELAAVLGVTDTLVSSTGDDVVVMDTAPSGHALRLLEMPALVHDWAKALMAILLKYQPVVGGGELGAVLVRISQGIGRLRELLCDPARSRFVAVTRAEALPRAETLRLLKRLRRLRIHVPAVVVNAIGAGSCQRCRRRIAAEHREIVTFVCGVTHAGSTPTLVLAPAEMPPPHRPARLLAWRRGWRTRVPAVRRG